MNVEQIMNQPAVTCRHDQSLNEAAQRMWDFDCGVLPIVDDEGRVVGMLTDRDICMAAYLRGLALSEIPIETAMACDVACCDRDDPIEVAESLMREYRVRRIPVVDSEHRPLGVVSIHDVVRYAASGALTQKADRDAVQTLAIIASPRRPSMVVRKAEPAVSIGHRLAG